MNNFTQKKFSPSFFMWGYIVLSIILFTLYFTVSNLFLLLFSFFFFMLFINTIEWITVTAEGIKVVCLIKRPTFYRYQDYHIEIKFRDYGRWGTRQLEFLTQTQQLVYSLKLNDFQNQSELLSVILSAYSLVKKQHLALPCQWPPLSDRLKLHTDTFEFTDQHIKINEQVFLRDDIVSITLDYPVVSTAYPDQLATNNPHLLTIYTRNAPVYTFPILNKIDVLATLHTYLLLYFQTSPGIYRVAC